MTNAPRSAGPSPRPEADVRAFRDAGEWRPRTIVQAVRDAVASRPDALAVASIEGQLSHRELDEVSDRFALGLLRSGLEPGDAVVFQVGNEIESVVAWYGVLKAGLVPVCSIPNHRQHEVLAVTRASGAKAHLYQADYRNYDLDGLSASVAAEAPAIATRIILRGESTTGARSMAELIDSAPADEAARVVDEVQQSLDPESIAIFQLSGGTTGIPKVIPHTHVTYTSAARRWARNLQWDESIVTLHFLPIMHHAGLCTALLPAHLSGGAAVMGRTIDAASLVELIERHRVQWMHFNLAAFEPLLAYTADRECDLSSITHFSWTFIRPEMSARAEEFLDAPAVGSFGMGEGVHLSARRDDPAEIRRHTVGSTIGEFDVAVVLEPDSEREVADGELGELCFKGPSVIAGYHDAPEVNATSFTSTGLLRSGDLGRALDIAGRRVFTVEGRLKDQISRGGEKFMADELEVLLARHEAVVEVAAVGVPDPGLGERVGVFVVAADPGVDPDELRKELVRFLDEQQVAKFKWPEHLFLIDALPRTGINKVRKDVLRGLAAEKVSEPKEQAQ